MTTPRQDKVARIIVVATLILIFLACVLGCGGFQAKQIIDAAADGEVKVMEAQAKIDKEKRQERYTIEGVVQSVEMREKEIPDPALKVSQEKGDTKVTQPMKKVKYCVVLFMDGREKEFNSVPNTPLTSGVYYKITYNGMQEVVEVQKTRE